MEQLRRPHESTLETARLRLEPLAPQHVDSLWDSVMESVDELKQWLPWAVSPTMKETLAFAETCKADWVENRSWTFAMCRGGEAIGTVGLADLEPQTRRAELGYWVRTADAGQGLMSEAAAATVDFGFSEIGLHRIELEAGVNNPGSIRVAEKLGFVREGLARKAGWAAPGFYDTVRFGLLSTDPRPS